MTQNAWENTVHLLNFTWPRHDYTMKIHNFTPKYAISDFWEHDLWHKMTLL